MASFLASFSVALFGLLLSLLPLWVLARRPEDGAESIVRFCAAFLLACFAFSAAALVAPPYYGRAALLLILWGAAALRWRGAAWSRLDTQFAGLLIGVALVSAVMPDTIYVQWDNYTHWSVTLKSFDFGAAYVGNSYTKFPTYPPFHTMLVYWLQGVVPFGTDNLQTYRILLLALLTVLLLFGTNGVAARDRVSRAVQLAVFPLLIALSFLLIGPLQSAYADFTAATLIAIAVAAAYHHLLQPRRSMFVLAGLAISALALTRPGMLPVALLLAAYFVALDAFGRQRIGALRLAVEGPAYAAVLLAPLLAFGIYSGTMLAFYGTIQATPAELLPSLRRLLAGEDPRLTSALVQFLLFEGKPSFRGYGVSTALLVFVGIALAALGAWFKPSRIAYLSFAAAMTALLLVWILAVTLQMEGFFHSDPTLPSYARYIGIVLFPFLVFAFMLHFHPAGGWAKRVSAALVIGAALTLQAGLLATQFWNPMHDRPGVAAISRQILPLVGDDNVWVLTSREVGDASFRTFAFRYFLIPAHASSNNCFYTPDCGEDTPARFANRLLAGNYRWVLVDYTDARSSSLVGPLTVADPADEQQPAGKPALFRVVEDASKPGGVGLVAVHNPASYNARDEVPAMGRPH